MTRSPLRAILALLAAVSTVLVVQGGSSTPASAACTASNLSASQLNTIFKNPGIGRTATAKGYAGGDYQHVYAAGAGRYLWLFQDVFFSNDNDLRDSLTAAAHNAGMLQTGNCWQLLGGPQMHNYVGSSLTKPLYRWFWPMDGEVGYDGALWVYFVEMQNPNGTGAGYGSRPVATWVARISLGTMRVGSFTKAKDPSNRLYGWSIVSDANYSYLYGHCYRQYANRVDGKGQFDSTCMPNDYLARVPKGHFDAPYQYWTGSGWSADGRSARPITHPGSAAYPMDVVKIGNKYVNATKVDDWWGLNFEISTAPAPQGPWTVHTPRITAYDKRKCTNGCGNYNMKILPYRQGDGQMVISISNGGKFSLWYANAYLYRPTFMAVPVP